MSILNFGSLNIDHVYRVPQFVRPGETLATREYVVHPGGKGLNQSIALARAGATVAHAGCIGADGEWLRELLANEGVDTTHLLNDDGATGHAIIQVSDTGENAILLHGGANQTITSEQGTSAFAAMGADGTVLFQNEINALPELMRAAWKKELAIAFNPAPMTPTVKTYPLELVNLLIVNEIEGQELSGETETDAVLATLHKRYPGAGIVLTLGGEGVRYRDAESEYAVATEPVKAVDTTAAGDTFIGYFLAERSEGVDVESALKTACHAAAVCVQRFGAASSIPHRSEL